MPDYALIQGVFIGCVSAYVIVLALIGPENHGSQFENSKPAFEGDLSEGDVNPARQQEIREFDGLSVGSSGGKEKEVVELVETKKRDSKISYV